MTVSSSTIAAIDLHTHAHTRTTSNQDRAPSHPAPSPQHPYPSARLFPQVGVGQSEQLALQSFAKQIATIERSCFELRELACASPSHEAYVLVGDLSTRRDYSDVEETAVGLSHLAMRGVYAPGEAFNFASGRARRMGDLLNLMLRQASTPQGRKIFVRRDGSRIRPADEPLLLGDASKVQQRLGWEPKHNLSRSLRRVLHYWRVKVRKG